jgi:hypothetical protein
MAARESLKGTTVKALPLGDRMETFGLLVIQDFLLKRGYVTAAKALSEEAKQVRVECSGCNIRVPRPSPPLSPLVPVRPCCVCFAAGIQPSRQSMV